MQSVPADGQQHSSNTRAFFPEVIWIITRSASLRAQWEIRVCCASSPCESIAASADRNIPRQQEQDGKNCGLSVVINITCVFIHLSGKKMHTVNNAFRHPVSQWWIINNVQRHWKYVEVYTVCPAGALPGGLGPLGNMRAPEFCQDASWENFTLRSHYNSANKHSCSRNIHTHTQRFHFDLTQKCLYTYSISWV